MPVVTARLEEPTLGVLDLDDLDEGAFLRELDLGHPPPRAVVQPRTDQDGDHDRTRLHGGRVVSAKIAVLATPTRTRAETLDRIAAYTRPGLRPLLVYSVDGHPERRIRLRGDRRSAPLTLPGSAEAQVSWHAPDGWWEAAELTVALAAAAADAEAGASYPIVHPLQFPTANPIGGVTITLPIDGVAVDPVLRLYGQATDPRIENQLTGQRLVFSGLTVAAGEYVEVDVRERTVRLLGLAHQSRYNRVDWAVSDWWQLHPGAQLVRYFPVAFNDQARAEIRYRPRGL